MSPAYPAILMKKYIATIAASISTPPIAIFFLFSFIIFAFEN